METDGVNPLDDIEADVPESNEAEEAEKEAEEIRHVGESNTTNSVNPTSSDSEEDADKGCLLDEMDKTPSRFLGKLIDC